MVKQHQVLTPWAMMKAAVKIKSTDVSAKWGALILFAVLILIFSLELRSFARVQDVWIDETTQLSGITLKFGGMLRWLTGLDTNHFGVPSDRMPPVSYIFDWLWLRMSGPSTLGFRFFHASFVLLGAIVIAVISLRELGTTAAAVSLLFLVLSPKLIQAGVEIRAYPIFFLVTCLQLAVFVRLVPSTNKTLSQSTNVNAKLLLIFGALCVVANYVHFYGIVSSCAFFLVLAIAFRPSSRSLVSVVVVFSILMFASIGLVPFVTTAVDQSPQIFSKGRTFGDYLAFLLRLIGGPANMVIVPAAAFFLGGTIALLVSGFIPAIARMRSNAAKSTDWLYLVLIAGIAAPIFSSFVITRFDVLNASYSVWIFAPMAVLVGASSVSITGFWFWDKVGRFGAIGASLAGALVSTFFFLDNASLFIHGPQRFVSRAFDEISGPKAILYTSPSGWEYSYFPLVFTRKGEIDQLRPVQEKFQMLVPGHAESTVDRSVPMDIVSAVAPYNHLLLVSTELRTYRDLRACNGPPESCPTFEQSKTEQILTKTGQCREQRVDRDFGIYDTRVKVFVRIKGTDASHDLRE